MKKKFVGVEFVETVRQGNNTFAFGIYRDARVGRVPFVGLAKKNPVDKENPTRGRNLAIARAFENLGKNIEKQEWKKIKNSGRRHAKNKSCSRQQKNETNIEKCKEKTDSRTDCTSEHKVTVYV